MSMTKSELKQFIKESIKNVFQETRIYNPQYGQEFRTSTEYTLTPEEQLAVKNMTTKERQSFATKKLKQTRREKGLCIQCGNKPPINKPDGTKGSYCADCLEGFRATRGKLAIKRGSCT